MTETSHTALVTGANRGIGLEVCRQLAQRGLRVILTSRSETEGSAAAAELSDSGFSVRTARMDVSDESSVRACRAALASAGERVDVVVNNAAICPPGGSLVVASDSIREAVQTNLLGPLWASRVFAPRMVRGGYGRIVNVSSGWGTFASGLAGPAESIVWLATLPDDGPTAGFFRDRSPVQW